MIKEFEERITIASGYILKECRQEKTEPIYDMIECSLKTGKKSLDNE